MTSSTTHTSPCFAAGDDAGALLFAEADSGGHGASHRARKHPVRVAGGPAQGIDPCLGPAAVTATHATPREASLA